MLESWPQARMRAIRAAGPQLRRIFDSSRAPGSDVADRLPGIFGDHDLAGPENDALQEMARSTRQNGTRGRRARAASQPGSEHVDLAAWRGRVEAVLDQPADRPQASQRPPRADHVEVDVGAVAGDDVAKVLLVPERQADEVVERIALARLGPVDHAGDLVTGDE